MDKDAISDNDGGMGKEGPHYKDNRHDQSIWNLLVYKYGLKVRGVGGRSEYCVVHLAWNRLG